MFLRPICSLLSNHQTIFVEQNAVSPQAKNSKTCWLITSFCVDKHGRIQHFFKGKGKRSVFCHCMHFRRIDKPTNMQKSRQSCCAQPIQTKLIPDFKDSFLHCFTWTFRLHLFSRLCPIFSRRLATNNDT